MQVGFNPRMPQFGARIQIKDGDAQAAVALGAASSVSTTVGSASGTGTVGSGLVTGGVGLMASGPDAAAAQLTLNSMNQLGSQQGVQYSQQNPLLGGAIQSAIGWSLVSGGGGAGSASRSKSPN